MKKIAVILSLLFILTACGNKAPQNATKTEGTNTKVSDDKDKNDMNNRNDKDDVNDKDNNANDAANGDVSIGISVQEAVDAFKAKYPNVKISEIELDRESLGYVYQVNGFDDKNEYELQLDAKDGKILREQSEPENTADDKEIKVDLISEIQSFIDKAQKEAGKEFFLNSYSFDIEEHGNFNKLSLELKNGSGAEYEYEYNLDTKELITKEK